MKPVVKLDPPFTRKPAKNYIFHLLEVHIRELRPMRALDAGCGELRNLRFFDCPYVGITIERGAYDAGLARPENKDWINQRGAPTVYKTRLENDFSFVGAFDLCVCTFAIRYVPDRLDVFRRLCERVQLGGSLIVESELADQPSFAAVLAENFEKVEWVYWGMPETLPEVEAENTAAETDMILFLSRVEMTQSNEPQSHTRFYVRATGKKIPPKDAGPLPVMRRDGNFFTVE